MGSRSENLINSMFVVTSIQKETLSLMWKIEDFKQAVDIAMDKNGAKIVAKFPAKMGVRFGQAFSVDCVVMLCDACDQDWDENDLSSKTIAVFLTPASETSQIRGGVPTAQDPWLKYFFSFSTEVILNNEVKLTQTVSTLRSFKSEIDKIYGFESGILFTTSRLSDFIDSEGSLTLRICINAFYSPNESSALSANDILQDTHLQEKFKNDTVQNIGKLLGDKDTSDVIISVVNETDEEIRSFACHKAILSAQSDVFRAMFSCHGMKEQNQGVVKMNDVSPEVVGYFLSFLYTGRLQNKRSANQDDIFIWVKSLPQLVYMAEKYNVEVLLQFCDENLHLAVTEKNAAEIFQLAKRHGLVNAETKLRQDFSKNPELLLQSICN